MTSSDKKETVVMHVEKVGYTEVDLKRRKKEKTPLTLARKLKAITLLAFSSYRETC